MPEWKETRVREKVVGSHAKLEGMDIEILQRENGDWSYWANILPMQLGVYQGAESRDLALHLVEEQLEHLLAQVRAMKEGKDASQGH